MDQRFRNTSTEHGTWNMEEVRCCREQNQRPGDHLYHMKRTGNPLINLQRKNERFRISRCHCNIALCLLMIPICCLNFVNFRSIQTSLDKSGTGTHMPVEFNGPYQPARVLASGWDENGLELYNQKKLDLEKPWIATLPVNIKPLGRFQVIGEKFWDFAFSVETQWEVETFRIFQRHVTPETVVVDFGAWIGPTLFFNAQIAKHVYAIEADPVAFAELEKNVDLNKNKAWHSRITVESACVGAHDDVGSTQMKSKRPGGSESGIGSRIFEEGQAGEIFYWTVNCYSLEDIFSKWGLQLSKEKVFIKIDIESYECRLLPSLFDWLSTVDPPRLPTIFVAFHNEIQTCTEDQWAGVLRIMKLYSTVRMDSRNTLGISAETSEAEFALMRKRYHEQQKEDKDGPYFVLTTE